MLETLPVWVSLVIPGFFLAMSGVAVAAAIHARKVAAAIGTTPIVRVASAEPGIAAFEGSVAAPMGHQLESTLTAARCCWFHVKVEKLVTRSADRPGSDTWSTIAEYTSCDPFLIADGTGSSAVYPDGAEVTPTDRSVWYGPTPFPEDRNPKRVGPGESTEGMLRIDGPSRRFRYTEERIYDGDPLYVIGRLERGAVDSDDEEDDAFDPNGASLGQPQFGVTKDDLEPYQKSTWAKASRFVELRGAVKQLARTRIVSIKAGKRRFLVSTTPPDTLLAANRGGAMAAFGVAAFPAALAALFLWARFFR
jgi:hypothetical protein